MSTRLADYDYALPRELIAQHPLPGRDAARMLVLHRESQAIEHARFRDLPAFLAPDDLLVLNNSRVLPARHFSDDGAFEFLVLEKLGPRRWKTLVKPARKLRGAVSIKGVLAEPGQRFADGSREIVLSRDHDLQHGGTMPLPPYIARDNEPDDAARYQTVFAAEAGSIAAPTAGLHFTADLLGKLSHVFITLHVGVGTFRPVKTQEIRDHLMHPEVFSISPPAAEAIARARRIVAVGTTSVRTLEAAARQQTSRNQELNARGQITSSTGETNIFIYPPFEFLMVDALLTNFHLPRSTLLMLVSAFAGRELILRAYAEAVRERYRFFSYGDCMLIL